MAQQSAQPQPNSKKKVRVPLVGNNQQRNTTDTNKDQRFVNCLVETTTNSVTNQKKLFLIKRPGTELYDDVVGSAAEGRGIWYYNNKIYSIFGSKLYEDGTEIETLSTATGMCGAVELIDSNNFSSASLFIADGIDAWIINNAGVVTRVDTRHLQWAGSTPTEAGDRRVPTTIGSYWYVAVTSGTTGTSEPTWPTTIGNTVTDGSITWRCEGTYSGPAKFQTSHAYAVGDEIIPTTENGYWYEVTIAGTSDSTEPSEWTLNLFDVTTSGSVTFECKGQYGGFPTPHVPQPVFMDGYIFLPDANSIDIYNSDITQPYGWGALALAAAESFPDYVTGLARQNNYIIAFGDTSTEFFYNQALADDLTDFDTPISRAETFITQVGILTRNCIMQTERLLLYIGQSDVGGYAVWKFDGTTPKEISTEYIEKFLDLESSTSGVTGWGIRINGHLLYVINLPTANRTFVYDIEENFWTEWQYNDSVLPFGAFADKNGDLLLQHKTNGKIYQLSLTLYRDTSSATVYPIETLIRFAKQDFETDNWKFFNQVTVIGDAVTDPIYLRWSDDDYQTWSNLKILPTGTRPYFKRLGNSRRRAWELTHDGNSALRLESLEVEYSIGSQ